MNKFFTILFKDESDADKMCVYKITIGKKYYIGSTINTTSRKNSWEQAVDDAFYNHRYGKNSVTNVMHHVLKNKKNEVGIMSVIELVESEDLLNETEQKWLSIAKGDKKCLNCRFRVSNSSRKKINDLQESSTEYNTSNPCQSNARG
mgnify:CR=1 FL=1